MDESAPVAPDDVQQAQAEPSGLVVCPYLVSAGGPWRSATPARDHRCSRAETGARLDIDHQRQYCLGSGGPGCPRFLDPPAIARLVPMLPVVLDHGPITVTLERRSLRRLAGPASVVVVGAALVAFLLARGPGAPAPAGGSAGSTARSPAPSVAPPSSAPVTAPPSEAPTPTPPPSPSPPPSPEPSPSAAARPSASPAPVAGGTYTVRKGDTLYSIAVRFGTTPAELARLNGIADPSYIRVGQVLRLP